VGEPYKRKIDKPMTDTVTPTTFIAIVHPRLVFHQVKTIHQTGKEKEATGNGHYKQFCCSKTIAY